MLFGKKRVILSVLFFLFVLPLNAYALNYVANVHVSVEKSLYGAGEEVHLSGRVMLRNLSASNNGFDHVSGALVNFTISNASGVQKQAVFNTTSDSKFKSRSEVNTEGIRVLAPSGSGYYNLTAIYTDPDNVQWKAGGAIKVYSEALDIISISPEKAGYYPLDNVSVTLKALREVGDEKVALANITINGSMRYGNHTRISEFSCKTGGDGACVTSVKAPSAVGTYILEANNFLSTSSFKVVLFDTYVYVKDSTGESFKEVFNTNEVATIEVRVALNGSAPTGDFVFNGTITDASNSVITNITSTNLNSNNSYTNLFSFTTSTQYQNGIYYVYITAFKTGDGSTSASTSFQVRTWTLTMAKAAQDSGFEYEYTTFSNKTVTLEIFPKERQNGTILANLNHTQFNITLNSKTGDTLATGNASWNSSCSGSGCYRFNLTTPAAAGSYKLSASLNYSNDVQTVNRILGVTTTSLSAIPSSSEGQLKELFSTTEFVYVSLSAKNETSIVNVTDVVVESVIYENGTRYAFTEVASWDNVNSTNSALEWALNSSAQRLKFDAPKAGGNYMIKLFINNRSAAAGTKFGINPYAVCGAAKSTAGSVDSSSSWYVWQYKTTDTAYIELKITQAQNALGRATAGGNSSSGMFSSSYYGMGSACSVDTTKSQVITNATITVESVVNLRTAAKASLNTSATYCSADNNQGTYTCIIKPTTKWDGGRYKANLKIVGSDGETTDKAESVFEARAFYLWAWSNSWTNKPASNITFTVDMYEAGTNWWSSYGSGGINGEVTIEKLEYNGKDGEWLWPPVDISYNTTGLNSSTVKNGRGSINLSTARLPKGRWEAGYYVLTIKGTNDATGESDYGQAWFGIRAWETYSTPVEQVGTSYRYKNTFGTKENVSLYVRITNAGDWNDNGGTSLGGTLSIGVKKLQFYTSWPPTELNSSAYTVNKISVSTSSPWYSSASTTTYAGYLLNISPAKGRWDGGYYNVILDVNGTETGYGWFEAKAFHVDTQPTDSSGAYKYTKKAAGPAYFNVSTTKNQKSGYSYYSAKDYINTTIKDVMLRTWNEATWEQVQLKYPNDINISPLNVTGTTLVTINKSGSWQSGYYWGEITLQDTENSTGTGYLWFSVRPFRVDTSVNTYTIDSTGNASVTLTLREPDWNNNNIVYGNYTVAQIYEDSWSGGTRTKTEYTNYAPSVNSSFNGTTILNITPSTAWSTNNNGYHYLTLVVTDNSDGSSQNGWMSFRAVPFSVSVASVPNAYSFPQGNNVTVNVTVTKALSGQSTSANLSRAFKWTWPQQTEYGFAVGSCLSATSGTCMINGTRNVTIIEPADGWGTDWHYIYLDFMSTDGASKIQADNSVWFKSTQPYDGYFSNYDSSYTNWKYYFGFTENLTITLYARNSNYAPQNVNVTKVEVSEDGSSCWSESCKAYRTYSHAVNGSNSSEIRGNGTLIIINNGTQWLRGQHSIRATVSGSAGTGVIRTGYVWVKDTSVPNITVVSPQNGAVINNGTSFLLNATSNEDVNCYTTLINYDRFSQWYCAGGSANASTPAACNSTRFNGSTEYYQYIYYPPYGNMNTGGRMHYYNFSTATMTNQDYGIQLWCYDTDWNYVEEKMAFKLNTTAFSSPIGVNLSSPANASTTNSTSATFNYNVTGPANAVATCSIYLNTSNLWRANTTTNITTTGNTTSMTNASISGLNNGTYIWNTYCYQATNTSNYAWAPANWTFSVVNQTSNASNATTSATSLVGVNLTSPANNGQVNTSIATFLYNVSGPSNVAMNCTIYTNTSGNWKANASDATIVTPGNAVNGTNSSLRKNISIAGFNTGTNSWNTYCYQIANTSNYAWAPANWTFSIISNVTNATQVTVSLTSPANASTINTSTATFSYNLNGTANSIANCSIYTNMSGWSINKTNLVSLLSANSNATNTTTISGFNNGTYLWNTHCELTTNTSNYGWGKNYTLTIAIINTSASINTTLITPADGSTVNSSIVNYNYTFTGASTADCTLWTNTTGTWKSNFTINSVSSGITPFNNTNLSNANYLWNVYCINSTDSTKTAWAANWTFNVNNNLSNATPQTQVTVSLTSPANASTINTSTATFSYNVTGTANAIVNCSIYTNMSGWSINKTNLVSLLSANSSATNTTSIASFNNGTYLWNTYCYLTTNTSNYAWAPTNWTFSVADLTSNASNTTSSQVAVNLSSPENGSTISTNMVPTYNVSGPSLVNCSVWGNFTGNWLANITNNSISKGSVSAGTLFLGAGFYEWNTRCVDSTNASNAAWAPGNFTFTRNPS